MGSRVGELTAESRELRAELAEARQRIDALSELVERLDGLLREPDP
ncbi:MAG: hypothetical protein VX498_01440 [Myxococcota bacterium]|nr:hypothetical protein [Myxococcota bacterium]